MLNCNVVLIADRIYSPITQMDIESNELEKIDDEYFNEIFQAISRISKKAYHYNSPKTFIDNIKKHKKDYVFTIYGGANSRNRMALIPSVCESYGIKYGGADCYARIICQDKNISKELAISFNIKTPNYFVFDNINTPSLEHLKLPVVVKPMLEGSSIGISNKSLVESYEEALSIAKEQYILYNQPIIIEEFIGGREVSVCIYGDSKKVHGLEMVEVYYEEEEGFFDKNLFTAQEKCFRKDNRSLRLVSHLLSFEDKQKFENIFLYLQKVDYLRIDGKLIDNDFHFIELTPDAHLGKNTHFASAYSMIGVKYENLIESIINISLNDYQN